MILRERYGIDVAAWKEDLTLGELYVLSKERLARPGTSGNAVP